MERAIHAGRRGIALWVVLISMPAVARGADPAPPASATGELNLAKAVVEALEGNLDLAAARRTLAAQEQQIGIARSPLLPQVKTGARAEYIDDDRSTGDRGNSSEESLAVAAGLTQVVYDEQSWAGYTAQKHVYTGQVAQYDGRRLDVAEAAAAAFLDLDRARATLDIQTRNRGLTAENLETSRARIAAGWSSEREVLRWRAQLASNDTDIVRARVRQTTQRFALNRVRNRPAEDEFAVKGATLEEYGFVYARADIASALRDPAADRRMRDLLVREGLARSPELRAIDAALAAEERLMTASRRAFWLPRFDVGAAVDYLASDGGGSGDFNETEWKLAAQVSFPLVQGGAKVARYRQTRETLRSLRLQRRATIQGLDQGIRSAFATSSGAWEAIAFARDQQTAARQNYELVNQSYQLGVASILGLLDAQSQLLLAEQAVVDAIFTFLDAVVAAEREMALFPFLQPEAEMQALLDRIEAEVVR